MTALKSQDPSSRALAPLAAVVVLSALALGAVYAWFVPISIDGGWYSYPGYALSQGRDPGENMKPIDAIGRESGTVRALFGYELRSFMLVPIHAAWFSLAGVSWLSLKLFGVTQWVLLAGLVGGMTYRMSRDRWLAACAALAAFSDGWVISKSMSDLRPDVPVAIAAVLTATLLVAYGNSGRRSWLMAASVMSVVLALLHVTSALSIALIGALGALLTMQRDASGRYHRAWAIVPPLCATAAYFLRQFVMDALVPSGVAAERQEYFREDLATQWAGIVALGIEGKLRVELNRWLDYAFLGNAAHTVFVLAGMVAVLRQGRTFTSSAGILLLAVVGAALVAAVIDPTPTVSHLIGLACVAYVVAAIGIGWWIRRTRWAAVLLAVLAVATVFLRGGQVVQLTVNSLNEGVSDASMRRFVSSVFDPTAQNTVIAPTFLWPYVDHDQSVVLVEPGLTMWTHDDERWRRITHVIVDRDLRARGWQTFIDEMERCNAFERLAVLGSEQATVFLEAYRVRRERCSPEQ